MRQAARLTVLWFALLPLLCGCEEGAEGASTQGGETRKGRPSQPPIPVAVLRAKVGPIASYYKATATLEVDKEAQVLARVSGIIESLEVEEGDLVEEDAVLLRIENEEYLFRLQQAEAKQQNLHMKHERMKEMVTQDLVSEEEFESLKHELATAAAEEALARLTLSYTTVKSPFAGRVVRRLVDVGQNVNANTPLFDVADFEPLLARVHVPSKAFRKIKTDQQVELALDSTGERLQGRIKLVSPTIDPTTGTIKVTVEIPKYPEGTRPGDFAEVRIVTETHRKAVLVDKNAVITDKGDTILYVASENLAERRVVEVGFTTDEHTEILSGVMPGEPVVVKGQRSLKHGYPLKILGDEASGLGPGERGLGT